MPLKINGTEISWSMLVYAVAGIFWLAGLSFQVVANTQDVASHVQVPAHTAQLVIDAELQANISFLRGEITRLANEIHELNERSL